MNQPPGRLERAIGIFVLTGFLGSGKTTLLNALLRDPRMRDTAVIVNEFGEVGLDHLLVAPGKENVVLLDSGCLCCTVADSLPATLEGLYGRRERGDVPAFRRVVVETTGLADPGPILRLLVGDYAVSRLYSVQGVLAVVDALLGAMQLADHAEAREQLAHADRVAISKIDLAEAGEVAALRRTLRQINAVAPVSEGTVNPDRSVVDGLVAYFLEDSPSGAIPAEHGRGDHEHGSLHDGIQAHAFYFDGPVSWPVYTAWLEGLRQLPARDLLRVKGLVEIDTPGKPYVVQGVQHLFGAPVRLDAWPGEDRRGRIVAIERGVGRDRLAAVLRAGEGGR